MEECDNLRWCFQTSCWTLPHYGDDQVVPNISKPVVVFQSTVTLIPCDKGKQKVGEEPFVQIFRPGQFIPGIGVGQTQIVYNLDPLSSMHIVGPTMTISPSFSIGYMHDQLVDMSLAGKENHMLGVKFGNFALPLQVPTISKNPMVNELNFFLTQFGAYKFSRQEHVACFHEDFYPQ